MIRHLQNEADVARASTWRRRRRIQESATRLPSHKPGPVDWNDVVRPLPEAVDPMPRRLPAKKSPAKKLLETVPAPVAENVPVILRLIERIPSGTDPLRDVAIVNILTGMGGKPSGPMTAMLVGDLAERIANGSIRLDHGDGHRRRRTGGWEAPHHFEEMKTYVIDRVREARLEEPNICAAKPYEMVCLLAQAMRVPNTLRDNDRYIDAVWTAGHDAVLGRRPTARRLMTVREALYLRDVTRARRRWNRGVSGPVRTAGSPTET